MSNPLVAVKNVKKYFPVYGGILNKEVGQVKAVDGVSLTIQEGETFGLVGESGCGKSTMGKVLLSLVEPTEGEVIINGSNWTKVKGRDLISLKKDAQIVFQDPYSSLNPRMKIIDILMEPLNAHKIGTKKERIALVEGIMEKVGLNRKQIYRYPHEFSGGQRQRIGVARALILNPKLIVLDEAVSALDVSIQSQILNLLIQLQDDFNLTYLFISHDLSVISHICDRVGVMYLGHLMEVADVSTLYEKPLHPYTLSLLEAVPVPDPTKRRKKKVLEGDVPSPSNPPKGCVFSTRCPRVMEVCREKRPPLVHLFDREIACHLYPGEIGENQPGAIGSEDEKVGKEGGSR